MTRILILIMSCGVMALSACSKAPLNSQASQQASQAVSEPASPKATPVSASAPTPQTEPTTHQTTYGQCVHGSDCVITKNACGMVTTVAQRNLNDYRKQQDKKSQIMRCAKPPVIDMTKISTQCLAGYCSVSGLAEQLVGTPFEMR